MDWSWCRRHCACYGDQFLPHRWHAVLRRGLWCAIGTKCCVARGEFRKLFPVPTTKHLSAKVHGKGFATCVRLVILYGRETWGLNASHLQQLGPRDRAIIHCICGTKDRDETPSASLLQKHGIADITAVLHSRRLRWYGYEQHATSSIKSFTDIVIPGKRRPKKA